LPPVMAFSTF